MKTREQIRHETLNELRKAKHLLAAAIDNDAASLTRIKASRRHIADAMVNIVELIEVME